MVTTKGFKQQRKESKLGKVNIFRIKCPFYTTCQPPEQSWPVCTNAPGSCDEFWVYEKKRLAELGSKKSIKTKKRA